MAALRGRGLVTSLAGVLAAPLVAGAQGAGKVWRIGWLNFGSGGPRVTFREALNELGYIEARNIIFEVRSGDGHNERLPALAAELAIRAAKAATTTTPILMAYWGGPDLVEFGIVASLSR